MFMYVTYITVLYLYINMFLVFLFVLTIYTTLITESYHQSKKKKLKKPIKINRNYLNYGNE